MESGGPTFITRSVSVLKPSPQPTSLDRGANVAQNVRLAQPLADAVEEPRQQPAAASVPLGVLRPEVPASHPALALEERGDMR